MISKHNKPTLEKYFLMIFGSLSVFVVAMACGYGLVNIQNKAIAVEPEPAVEVLPVSDKILVEPVVEEVVEEEYIEEEYYEPYYDYSYSSYDYPSGDGVLTRSGGVNYYDGNRETWYSSNALYHYRTGEWTCGNDGVYRDSDGYVVVASSDLSQGSTVDTSLGQGKVYDSGCASGTVDIYTNW